LEEKTLQGGGGVNSGNSNNSPPKTADIVILGAGVMGTSIAFHLAQRKAGKIVVLDKDRVGRGGSARSSALIRMHYSFPPEVQLALVSLHMFQNWQEIVGQPVHSTPAASRRTNRSSRNTNMWMIRNSQEQA
jgi:glycine/D-amino acid oxidase-like deaminating enzyme